MYELPTSITVADNTYTIRNRGDYRMVIDCFEALQDETLTQDERIYASLIIFLEDMNTIEDIAQIPDVVNVYKEMVRFFNCGQDNVPGAQTEYKLLDWEKDSPMICSAVNKVANTEIRALEYLHWWTFMGYYMAVGESSLSTVVSIRYKVATHQKLEDHEKKFKQHNPQYFAWDMRSLKQREADEHWRKVWNGEETPQ